MVRTVWLEHQEQPVHLAHPENPVYLGQME
jgi:hypothetical protein